MDQANKDNVISLIQPFKNDIVAVYELLGTLNQDISEQAVIIDYFFPKYHTEGHLVKKDQIWQNKQTKKLYKVIEDFIAYPPVLEDIQTKETLKLGWRDLFTNFTKLEQ